MPKKKEKMERSLDLDLDSICEGIEDLAKGVTPKPREFLHTGNLALDYRISMKVDGTGGYPLACIVELYGEPSTGKSLLLAKAAAEAQKKGILPIIADAEGRWDDDFAAQQGVDVDKRKLFIPDTVEAFATTSNEILNACVDNHKRVLLILDSLAILSTLKETEDMDGGEMKADQGRKAQRIKQAMRVLKSKVRESGSMMLIANHVIANPGSYIQRKETPGGGGVPFQASVRIELLSTKKIEIPGKAMSAGVIMHAKVAKNSVAPPFGECEIDVRWATGVDKYSGLIPILEDIGIISRHGAWYEYQDKRFQSSGFADFVEATPEILQDPRISKPYFLGG